MAQKRVLLIGIDPAVVNFSRPQERNADTVRAAGNTAQEQLSALGYEVQNCLIDLGETAEAVVLQALTQHQFACIMIGAGIRALPQHTRLFERIINVIHEHAPGAKLCFNTNPADTADAVLSWV